MEARYIQTEGVLREFHKNFEKSRSEMIQRLLHDQESLNNRFAQFDLNVDAIEKDGLGDDQPVSTGITAEDLHNNFRQNRGRDMDADSVRSLKTECSFTDSSEDGVQQAPVKSKAGVPPKPHRPVSSTSGRETVCQKLSLSTPRFEKPERKVEKIKKPRATPPWADRNKVKQENQSTTPEKSKSVKTPPSTNALSSSRPRSRKIEQPPNSPETTRRQDPVSTETTRRQDPVSTSKPPLHTIRTGRKPQEKAEKGKKLLKKRPERPNTAMGLLSPGDVSLVPDMDSHVQDTYSNWDTESLATSVRTGVSVRSAPLPLRQKKLSWESNELKDNYHSFVSRRNSQKVPSLGPNQSQGGESGSNSLYNTPRVDSNHGEKVRFRSVTPSYSNTYETSVDKPRGTFDKSRSISRSKSISVRPFNKSQSDYFSSSKMADLDPVNSPKIPNDSQGHLRRTKGHGSLNRSQGAQVAVLKLPPVSKIQTPDIPKRSGTSLAYYGGNEASVIKMMPVHIGEEF